MAEIATELEFYTYMKYIQNIWGFTSPVGSIKGLSRHRGLKASALKKEPGQVWVKGLAQKVESSRVSFLAVQRSEITPCLMPYFPSMAFQPWKTCWTYEMLKLLSCFGVI